MSGSFLLSCAFAFLTFVFAMMYLTASWSREANKALIGAFVSLTLVIVFYNL